MAESKKTKDAAAEEKVAETKAAKPKAAMKKATASKAAKPKTTKAKAEAKPAAKAKAAPKAAKPKTGKTIVVRQVRSPNRRPEEQRATLIGLGLNKMHKTRELEDTPAVRGMIRKIPHLVEIVEERG